MPRLEIAAGAGLASRYSTVDVGLAVVQMRWLSALNKIELVLLIVSAGMLAAGLLLLLEIVLVLSPISWQ